MIVRSNRNATILFITATPTDKRFRVAGVLAERENPAWLPRRNDRNLASVPGAALFIGNVHPHRTKDEIVRRPRTNEIAFAARRRLNFQRPYSSRCLLRLAADRFHVLFNPLFRVLFDFPSRYLSAIGLVGRYLALDGVYHPRLSQKSERSSLDCTLKQSDSFEDDAFLHHDCAEECRQQRGF